MHHSVWGDATKPRLDTINHLSQLPEVATTANVVLVGDFNVDYINHKAAYVPLEALPKMVVRNGPRATSSVTASKDTLKNAYDQMFTRGVTPPGAPVTDPGSGPYNFATEVCSRAR